MQTCIDIIIYISNVNFVMCRENQKCKQYKNHRDASAIIDTLKEECQCCNTASKSKT